MTRRQLDQLVVLQRVEGFWRRYAEELAAVRQAGPAYAAIAAAVTQLEAMAQMGDACRGIVDIEETAPDALFESRLARK